MNYEDSAAVAAIFVQHISQVAFDIKYSYTAPSAVYRPALSIDGNQWCALYGEDLQNGIAGFGDTPESAMADFDMNWRKPLRNSPSGLKTQ